MAKVDPSARVDRAAPGSRAAAQTTYIWSRPEAQTRKAARWAHSSRAKPRSGQTWHAHGSQVRGRLAHGWQDRGSHARGRQDRSDNWRTQAGSKRRGRTPPPEDEARKCQRQQHLEDEARRQQPQAMPSPTVPPRSPRDRPSPTEKPSPDTGPGGTTTIENVGEARRRQLDASGTARTRSTSTRSRPKEPGEGVRRRSRSAQARCEAAASAAASSSAAPGDTLERFGNNSMWSLAVLNVGALPGMKTGRARRP